MLLSRSQTEHKSAALWSNPVGVDVAELVAHSGNGRFLPLKPGRIRSVQGGSYLSPFKGRGMEFVEARPYQPGDDIRYLDWRLTARSGKAHSKIFQEERDRSVLLWLDLGPSMFFATSGAFKAVVASHAASLLGWASVHQGDKVGGMIVSGDNRRELRPQLGKNGVLHYIKEVVRHPSWEGSFSNRNAAENNKSNLLGLRRVAHGGSLIFIFTDMQQFDPSVEMRLGHLARHSDIFLCFVYDRLEATLPPAGRYRVSDGQKAFSFHSGRKKFRQEYAAAFDHRWQQLEKLCQRLKIRFLPIATDDNLLPVLQKGLGISPNGRPGL